MVKFNLLSLYNPRTEYWICQQAAECEHPVRPAYNSISKCDITHGLCNITCFDYHEFPNGENILQFECRQGYWVMRRSRYRDIPACDRKILIK